MIKRITILYIIFWSFSVNGQSYLVGDTLIVNALGGLNVRTQPNLSSEIVEKLNYGKKIIVESTPLPENNDTISNFVGNWIEVGIGNTSGYVFDSYLSQLPVFEFKQNTGSKCAMENILYYIHKLVKNYGIVDTTHYTNCSDGEGYFKMTIYELEDGHQYISSTGWEDYTDELQLVNIRNIEVVQIMRNAFQMCGELTENIEPLLSGKYKYINANIAFDPQCCGLRIRQYGDRVSIKVYGSDN